MTTPRTYAAPGAAGLAGAATALAVALAAVPAQAAESDPWRTEPVSPAVNGSAYEPFAGDFDGDGLDDLFFYRPGSGQDYLKFTEPGLEFPAATPVTVNGDYEPLVGDFAAPAGVDDVLWYDFRLGWFYLSVFDTEGSRTTTRLTRPEESFPVLLDHARTSDGAEYDEVLWVGRRTQPDRVDRFTAGAGGSVSVSSRAVTINSAWSHYLVDDVDGNGWADLLLVVGIGVAGPNSRLWSHEGTPGTGTTGYTSAPLDVPSGWPFAGRFDGSLDGTGDVLVAGSDTGHLLTGPGPGFTASSWDQPSQPDRGADVLRGRRGSPESGDLLLVQAPGSGAVAIHETEPGLPVAATDPGGSDYVPVVGDFAGSGQDSVFLYGRGSAPERVLTRD